MPLPAPVMRADLTVIVMSLLDMQVEGMDLLDALYLSIASVRVSVTITSACHLQDN